MMQTGYMRPRAVRREARTLAGRFGGGKLAPVMAVPFRESESGSVTQAITYELDPVAGRLITQVSADIVAVFVPTQAIEALKDPEGDYPGSTDVVRAKLLSGTALFGLETEGEISKRLGLEPRSINGVKKVNEVARLAHNAAVNFLRLRKYHEAAQLTAANTDVTPAIIGQNVLDRLNAVLDPEDRVNGAVNLEGQLNVHSVQNTLPHSNYLPTSGDDAPDGSVGDFEWVDSEGNPTIWAELGGAGNISLTDFYQAETMDRITREMERLRKQYPQYGDELITRMAHGLSIDPGKQPFVVYERTATFGNFIERPSDGASLGDVQSFLTAQHSFTVPIPATELGGVLITFAVVRPDETLPSQPHPILSDVWTARNFAQDELAIDPVPVTVRELDADCDTGDEETISCYIGNNGLHRYYENYGFNRHVDLQTVEAKTAVWQMEIPYSVTPETILYPETLDAYPFGDQLAEICTYTISSMASVNTPMIFGPTPVEDIDVIDDENIFGDVEE